MEKSKFTSNNACVELARLYETGCVVDANLNDAIEWMSLVSLDNELTVYYCSLLLKRNSPDDLERAYSLCIDNNILNYNLLVDLINKSFNNKLSEDKYKYVELCYNSLEKTVELQRLYSVFLLKKTGSDKIASINILESLANGGDLESCFQLGKIYYRGLGVKKDYEKAKRWYYLSTEGGVKGSCNELFDLLLELKSFDSYSEAFKLVSSEIYAKDPYIQGRLGLLYLDGLGVDKDVDRAISLLTFASLHGVSWAKIKTVDLLVKRNKTNDRAVAFDLLNSMDKTNLEVSSRLARFYRYGYVVSKDLGKAIQLYYDSLNSKIPWIRNELFDCLCELGTDEAYCNAIEVISHNVKKEDGYAMGRLSRMYRNGFGVSKDLDKAIELMSSAKSHNVPWAEVEYIELLLERSGDDDLKNAYESCITLAERGNMSAKKILGMMYKEGIYVDKDFDMAIKWLND